MDQIRLEWLEAGQPHTELLSLETPTHKQVGKVLIGRDPSQCDVVLSDKRVSRLHAEIIFDPKKQVFQLHSLKDENPIYLNARAIRSRYVTLSNGSRIQLGNTEIQFQQISSPMLHPQTDMNFLSFSQILPLPKGQDQASAELLVPGIFNVVWVALMFGSIGNTSLFNILLASYLGAAGFYTIYRLCEKSKPWWVLLLPVILTPVFLVTPIWPLLVFVFRVVLPGDISNLEGDPLTIFITFFFGAGLVEEILKSLAIFVLMLWGHKLQPPWQERLGVLEPLDGILLGAASGLGFTLGEYVPSIIEIEQTTTEYGPEAGELVGLHLLIPRIVGSVFGHMAYSGIFGYYIGLSVLKQDQQWLLLTIGLLLSAALHTFWNFSGVITFWGLPIAGLLAYLMLLGSIRKAKQIALKRKPAPPL